MIDLTQSKNDEPIRKLIEKHEVKAKASKELPKLDVSPPVLYDKNADSTKIKHPKWCKSTIKDRQNPHKYGILTDYSN